MSEAKHSIKKAIPLIALSWILSLVTTIGIVYFAPNIFPPIQTANIGDSAVTASKIADGAVLTIKLADGSVTSMKILDGTITASDLADGSIITIKIADGAVTTDKIADNSVTSAKIADSAVVTVKLANNSVTSEKIADGNITTDDIADNAVTTSKIVDDAVVTVKLADGSVTSAKILDGTITTVDLADGSLTTVKIADGAITTNKIADFAVTNLKLAPGAIPFFSKYSDTDITTTSTSWVDMTGLSVTITLERTSNVLILLTVAAMNDPGYRAYVRALIGNQQAYDPLTLTPAVGNFTDGFQQVWMHCYTYCFYKPAVAAGTYNVKIQWMVSGGSAYSSGGYLVVIGLPA